MIAEARNQDWYEDRRNLCALARWLDEEYDYEKKDLIRFLEKPQNWTPEWEIFQRETTGVKHGTT